ncbi:MAG TPA: hypothetical protein PLW93_05510 [Candidatus Absconditabacterales bacterium]|nr:hypothetical protein [Candidatus Absconditabacterales bacterium]HNG97702.1 hypothetical protein [Candidatus Absconditabacterales bacterium]
MIQQSLFDITGSQSIHFQNMKMDFDMVEEQAYVGLLELNSNKFYVQFSLDERGCIGEFQIFGAKGYFELNISVIKMIRNIVHNLYQLAYRSV